MTGRKNYIMIQAEDELASIGMVIGASWNGARAFTATSGPGISLMQEFIGLAYYTETPAVFSTCSASGPRPACRRAPSSATSTRRAYASHGDTRQVCLYPANPEECFYIRAAGLRPGRAPADAGVGAVGPRHRHERLDVPGISSGTTATCPTAARCSTTRRWRRSSKFWRYYDHDDDGIP